MAMVDKRIEKARRRLEAAEREHAKAQRAYRAALRTAGFEDELRRISDRERDGAREEWRRRYGDRIAERLDPFVTYVLLAVRGGHVAVSGGTLRQVRDRVVAAGVTVRGREHCHAGVQGLHLTRYADRILAIDPSLADLRKLAG